VAAFSDPTVRHLQRMSPRTANGAFRLVSHVRNAGVPLWVSSALRTSAEQADLRRRGLSQTLRSKHLTGEAFDIDVHGFGRDQIPLWWLYNLGSLGEQLGLRWGGRWSGFRDYGHFEDMRSIR